MIFYKTNTAQVVKRDNPKPALTLSGPVCLWSRHSGRQVDRAHVLRPQLFSDEPGDETRVKLSSRLLSAAGDLVWAWGRHVAGVPPGSWLEQGPPRRATHLVRAGPPSPRDSSDWPPCCWVPPGSSCQVVLTSAECGGRPGVGLGPPCCWGSPGILVRAGPPSPRDSSDCWESWRRAMPNSSHRRNRCLPPWQGLVSQFSPLLLTSVAIACPLCGPVLITCRIADVAALCCRYGAVTTDGVADAAAVAGAGQRRLCCVWRRGGDDLR
ncbi:hypothetical protein EGW08_004125 [Elysia chlorotica]|uniref:Uncharacterized protein n=1 Tax=Elysia chlorotica TaxID=188477 RepID=A0A3S1BNZ7_ELYCH|nr:hypothetical protein EGW08_004125 [Elysia chlorotica]